MFRKHTWMALGIFTVLLAGGLAVMYRKLERGIVRISFADVPVERCDRIEITGPRGFVVRQEQGQWVVPSGRAADVDTVKQFFSTIQHLQSSDLLTQDGGRFAELEVDSSKGHTISLYEGNKLLTSFVVGRTGHMDMALRQGDDVYRILHSSPGQLLRSPMEWLDRRMHQDDLAHVVRVHVAQHGKPTYDLIQRPASGDGNQLHWQWADMSVFPKDFRFDHEVSQGEVTTLLQMRANELLDKDPGPEITGLKDPKVDVFTWYVLPQVAKDPDLLRKPDFGMQDIVAMGGHRRSLTIGKAQDERSVYAQMDGDETIYTLSSYTIDTLRRNLEDYRETTLMHEGDIHQVAELTIANGSGQPIVLLKQAASSYKFAPHSLQPPPGFRLDPLKVLRRLASVIHARAGRISPLQDKLFAGLQEPKRYLHLRYEDGRQETLAIGKPIPNGGGDCYALGSRDTKIYRITKYLIDSLLGGLDTLVPDGDVINTSKVANPEDIPEDVKASMEEQQNKREKEQEMLRQIRKQQAKSGPSAKSTTQVVQEPKP